MTTPTKDRRLERVDLLTNVRLQRPARRRRRLDRRRVYIAACVTAFVVGMHYPAWLLFS